ncbi:uncharacterized protein DUF1203 [Luteimonas cucumeris]|uniref:Uncharacterized protein DUF1203 n=1 Tax=Luteimonas cucumeris TaxID=985012 RepID=A0A562L1Y1_9GAMM|nr:DUF1203 domain-containing protein [Luteimonas cucumeris]TWI01641.1 uncharacterized protein DUF1203 [Luteimonas cucumeris]
MDYIVSGLPIEPFQSLFGLDDEALRERGAVRQVAEASHGYPCRVSLQDAEPGETLLLLHWRHHDVDTPYRASGPIYVREAAQAMARVRNSVPPQQQRRLLSVRAYDREGWMQQAEVVDGAALEPLIERYFDDTRIDYLHVHNARPGCYACRIDRG